MTIEKLFFTIYAITIAMLLVLLGSVFWMTSALAQVNASQEVRFESYLLADELRQSSDDLTRLARTYAVTGDAKWEEMYWNILAIRNGEKPRPVDYERIYWDFVASTGQKPRPDGETAALNALMEKAGFTEDEFAKLTEAQNNSDELVLSETIAMNAVKGLYDDGTGNFVVEGEPDLVLAQTLTHDQSYHDAKARIMEPLDQFFVLLDNRTNEAVQSNIQKSNWIRNGVIALVFVQIAIAVISLSFLRRRVSRPIQQAVQTAQEMADIDLVLLTDELSALAQGDLTRTLNITERTIQVNSNDDVGMMLKAFNAINERLRGSAAAFSAMTTNLHSLIGQIQSNADGVMSASSQLNVATQQSGEATQQIAQTIGQVAVGNAQLSQNVERTNRAVAEQVRAIESIATGAQRQIKAVEEAKQVLDGRLAKAIHGVDEAAKQNAQVATEVSAAAESGQVAVHRTIEGIQAIAQATEQVATRVNEMGERSRQIGQIVETINAISERTNLLALNAAIEAARAGEHGKGFAVVADEVRKLAEQSTRSTSEIATIIKAVQDAASQTATAMETGRQRVDEGIERAEEAQTGLERIQAGAERTKEQLQKLLSAVADMEKSSDMLKTVMTQVSAIVEENTAAAEESAAGSDQVLQAMGEISAISEENSAAAEQVSASSEEVSAQVEETGAAAESLSQMARDLRALVSQFQLEQGSSWVAGEKATPAAVLNSISTRGKSVQPGGKGRQGSRLPERAGRAVVGTHTNGKGH